MPVFPPAQIATWTGGRWTAEPAAALVGFTMDTRHLSAGQVFVALKTERRDGHEFLSAAQTAGASAAIVAVANPTLTLPQLVVPDPLMAFQAIAREQRRLFHGPVIGISGSAGKTSTKNLLALLLGGEAGGVLSTDGNLNNHLGVPLTLTRLDPAVHKFAVVEAGISAPGEMKPLADMIEPDVALITLIAGAHTAELGGLNGVAREKAVLPAAIRTKGVAIFPKQCTQFPAFRDMFVNQLVLERSATLHPATQPRHTIHFNVLQRTTESVIVISYGAPPPAMFKFRRMSDGMAQNAALALTAALHLGVAPEVLQTRLAGWTQPPLRGEIRQEDGRLLYLDCYNANPASMADALSTFHAIAPASEPRLYVIGCMEELGSESIAEHHALGRLLAMREDDHLVVIGTQANQVCAGVLEQGDFTRQIQIASALEAISGVLAEWRGAVFMKGSRRYQLERTLSSAVAREATHA